MFISGVVLYLLSAELRKSSIALKSGAIEDQILTVYAAYFTLERPGYPEKGG